MNINNFDTRPFEESVSEASESICLNFIVQLETLMHVLLGQSVFPRFTYGRIKYNQLLFWLYLG